MEDFCISIYLSIQRDKDYISEHKQNAHNDGNIAQPLKRLLETRVSSLKDSSVLLITE